MERWRLGSRDGWLGLYFGVAIVDPRDLPERMRRERVGLNLPNGWALGDGSDDRDSQALVPG